MEKYRYDVAIFPEQQEFILELIKPYKDYESLPDNLKSVINERRFDQLVSLLNHNKDLSNLTNRKKKLFVLVDYINSFNTGVFGSEEARSIDDSVYERTKSALEDHDTKVVVLIDFHDNDLYKNTREGRSLPIHCNTSEERMIYGKTGELFNEYYDNDEGEYKSDGKVIFIYKSTFGSLKVNGFINGDINEYINRLTPILEDPDLNGESLMRKMDPDLEYDWNMIYYTYSNLVNGMWVPDEIELSGVATNVCVLSNAIILMSEYSDAEIYIHKNAVASYNSILHEYALEIMKGLGIHIIED